MKRSNVWNEFTAQDEIRATCNHCQEILSYKTTISNLKKHLKRKHSIVINSEEPVNETLKKTDSEISHTQKRNKKISDVWNIFTPQDQKNAICNICKTTVNYSKSESNMKRHVMRKHPAIIIKLSNELNSSLPAKISVTNEYETSHRDTSRKRPRELHKPSPTWNFFTKQNEIFANCNLCNATLSYKSTTNNLRHHLTRKHPDISKDPEMLSREYNTMSDKSSTDITHEEQFSESDICDIEQNFNYIVPTETLSVEDKAVENNPIELDELIDDTSDTIWSHAEVLAMINIYSIHKNVKENLKWNLIARNLLKLNVEKTPDQCEYKWNTLMKSYQAYKPSDNEQEHYEIFSELTKILSDKEHSTYNAVIGKQHEPGYSQYFIVTKTEKQKRHEDRMDLLRKKLEIEERKVIAFEDYLKFLKSTHNTNINDANQTQKV